MSCRAALQLMASYFAGAVVTPRLLNLLSKPAEGDDPAGIASGIEAWVTPPEKPLTGIENIARLVEANITRQYVIEGGKIVDTHTGDKKTLKLAYPPLVRSNFAGVPIMYYNGIVYMGNQFAIPWTDPEHGDVKLYGFEAAIYNIKSEKWAAVPIIWPATSIAENVITQISPNVGHSGQRRIQEPYNKAQRRFKIGEPLEMAFVVGNGAKFDDFMNKNSSNDGAFIHDGVVRRAFGQTLCAGELIAWINGGTVLPKKPVFAAALVHLI